MADRQTQACDVCGQVDDHPRHITCFPGGEGSEAASLEVIQKAVDAGVDAQGLQTLVDPSTRVRHFDCCAQQGCQVCSQVLESVGDVRGSELVSKLTED